jgi:hypothetical protein
VSTKELDEGTEQVTITATNTKNNGSVERTFNINVTSADGIIITNADRTVVAEECYNLNGMRVEATAKGVSIIRQRMSDGSCQTIKRIIK